MLARAQCSVHLLMTSVHETKDSTFVEDANGKLYRLGKNTGDDWGLRIGTVSGRMEHA